MRSRYTAYVRRDAPYLMRTWHPRTRPVQLDLDGAGWRGLEILSTSKGQAADATGVVSFVAHYGNGAGESGAMRETSRFVILDGAWVYVDGDVR
ncbi:YchJ family protein [Demequina aurantiaca]|uniref:YchJ family protein n=1 Tax=Demequina aurantiaca TaxID=676200 RepID=UPI003D335586